MCINDGVKKIDVIVEEHLEYCLVSKVKKYIQNTLIMVTNKLFNNSFDRLAKLILPSYYMIILLTGIYSKREKCKYSNTNIPSLN